MNRRAGFTLVELLVAVLITSIVFVLGYGAINQAVKNRSGLEASQARLVAVQGTMQTLVQDFSQLVPRPVRDPLGQGYEPALLADGRGNALAVLTRGGWANPAGVQRSTLQRVRYVLENRALRREYWTVLDATLDPPPRRRALLDGVRGVSLRFMDATRNWQTAWPPLQTQPGPADGALRLRPIAVEVTLELEDWGRITRLIEVPG